ncbi:MAG: polysaccharide deacetylase family protein [Flavobacteriales bacterium]|nr:polysaccharide deacetylase family protein [Flavobacteriales bacterium]
MNSIKSIKYPVKTPFWASWLWPAAYWRIKTTQPELYLTFDDGPHPKFTPWVLDQLKQADAKATFFCIGKNIQRYPEVFRRIIHEGHAVGNHTWNHTHAFHTSTNQYLREVEQTDLLTGSGLFRPPYGKMTPGLYRILRKTHRIVMWDVLSGDFDLRVNGEICAQRVIHYARPGSIIVFHDSQKAWPRLQTALPRVISHFQKQGYRFLSLNAGN